MAKHDTRESNPSGDAKEEPGVSEPNKDLKAAQLSPELAKFLGLLTDLLLTAQNQAPKDKQDAQKAVDKLNIVLGGLELPPAPNTQTPASGASALASQSTSP